MHAPGFAVFLDIQGKRIPAGFRAPSTEKPVMIALRLRELGWDPYRVTFDALAGAWVAHAFGHRVTRVLPAGGRNRQP
jgi:hypothetical protein